MDDILVNNINNKKWKNIINLLRENKIKSDIKIYDDKTLCHIAVINNIPILIDYYIKHYPEILFKSDLLGNTPCHYALKYRNSQLYQKIVKPFPKVLDYVNNKGETCLHLIDDINLIRWTIENINGLNFDILTNKFMSPLTLAIQNNNINIVKLLSKSGASLNFPEQLPPLCLAVILNNPDIVSYLLNNKANVNIKNAHFLTPLILGARNGNMNMCKSLLEYGADPNYSGPEGDHNPLDITMKMKKYEITSLLIDYNAKPTLQNRFFDTPTHTAMIMSNIPTDLRYKIIYYGNMNIPNIDGETPLHYLMKRKDWSIYEGILEKKKLDIFSKNNSGHSPLFFVRANELSKFMDIVATSYLHNIKNKNENENIDCKNMTSKCKQKIKKYIISQKRSIPDFKKDEITLNKFVFIKPKHSDFGQFNPNSMNNILYTLFLLKKYPTLGVPYRYYLYEKDTTNKLITNDLNFTHSAYGNIICDLTGLYSDLSFELSPYLIIWRSEDIHYFSPDLDSGIQKLLLADKIRFIWCKLTLIPSTKTTHSNVILFDKQTGIMERFEPYGVIPYVQSDELDNCLKHKFKILFDSFLTQKKLKFTYLRPVDFLPDISFQSLSNDEYVEVKKLGDPPGYCLAWSFWYLDTRLSNPDIHPKDIFKLTTKKIIEFGKESNKEDGTINEKIFISYIRSYARKINNTKDSYLISMGLKKSHLYDLILQNKEQQIIKKKFAQLFNEIINKNFSF